LYSIKLGEHYRIPYINIADLFENIDDMKESVGLYDPKSEEYHLIEDFLEDKEKI